MRDFILLPPMVVVLVYLPFLLQWPDQRYFFPALPFLVMDSLILWPGTPRDPSSRGRLWRRWRSALVAVGVLAPALGIYGLWWARDSQAGRYAYEVARRMQQVHLRGPIAGSASIPGGRAGLYLAYFLDEPWYGDVPLPAPKAYRSSGASFIAVRRRSKLAAAMKRAPYYRNLDPLLWPQHNPVENPLQVFEPESSSRRPEGNK